MPDLEKLYLFRMLHVDNIQHVWQNGITKIDSINANPKYKSIGDGSLIHNRNLFSMPNGKTLGNYIPFYFWYKMPMLYIIQKGFKGVDPVLSENIVYCLTTVSQIITHEIDYVFSDGHGVNSFSSFYFPNDILKIENLLDFKAIKDLYWNDEQDLDKKRRKEAEFLLAEDLPQSAIAGFVVYNEIVKAKLINLGIPEEKIIIKTGFYF